MARGRDDGPPAGVFPAGSARAHDIERIAERAADFVDEPPEAEGVVPLNPGFFKLQRMRGGPVAKSRGPARERIGGK